ncbi:MAG: hypothetical protein JW950_10655 [Deltaproteobacteria bacterium]|nr:hypothetical protein [Deltaproteobacteria bacterium]
MAASENAYQEFYNEIMVKFGYPQSRYLRNLLEAVYSGEEARLCLALPATAEEVANRLTLDVKAVTEQLDGMAAAGSIQRVSGPGDQFTYMPIFMPEVFCDSMMHSMGADWDEEYHTLKGEKNRRIADLFHEFFEKDWFRFARTDELLHRRVEMLGGASAFLTFTVTPAWKALEKCHADPPPEPGYDLRNVAAKAKEEGEKIYANVCACRVRARKSSAPTWTCGSMPARYLLPAPWTGHPKKTYKEWEPDEWLEMMGRCEEEFAMVHIGLPPMMYDICTCDTECCNIFYPLRTYAHCYEGLDKSPYRAVVDEAICKGQANCVKRCRFEAISLKTDPVSKKRLAVVDAERCHGCGQCVLGCKIDGAIRLELAANL